MSNAIIFLKGQILLCHLFIFSKIAFLKSCSVSDFNKNLRFVFACRDFTTFLRKNKNHIILKNAENNLFMSLI